MNELFMLICCWSLSDSENQITADSRTGEIPRRRFSAASISPERSLFGSNYDLRGFEKLQMPSSLLP
jgi:hypothetical protein